MRLPAVVKKLISMGVTEFVGGGAVGFDVLAAKAVLRARRKHPNVTFTILLPYKHYDSQWSERRKAQLGRLSAAADRVVRLEEQYAPGSVRRRNIRMVEDAAYCVAFLQDPTKHMTCFTVQYAKERGLAVYNLAEGEMP